MNGLIALDIDGTLTAGLKGIPPAVVSYLHELNKSGWELAFITGRCFAWTHPTLEVLSFDYHLGVQNGAALLQMPQRDIVAQRTIDRARFAAVEEICQAYPTDYAIFSGCEKGDVIYYRPDRHEAPQRNYLEERARKLGEKWVAVDSYETLDITAAASLKVIADLPIARSFAEDIEKSLGLYCPLIHDPYGPDYFVAQITHPKANKGDAACALHAHLGGKGILIAAGDDRNDLPMLKAADYAIAMATAPEEMHEFAHVIAPPSSEEGIITGLRSILNEIGGTTHGPS
jgi:HAD superfamily hydrolase (TIGR01484 family)